MSDQVALFYWSKFRMLCDTRSLEIYLLLCGPNGNLSLRHCLGDGVSIDSKEKLVIPTLIDNVHHIVSLNSPHQTINQLIYLYHILLFVFCFS